MKSRLKSMKLYIRGISFRDKKGGNKVFELKAKTMSDLKFGISPTAKTCRVDNERFINAAKELEAKGKVIVVYINTILSNGQRHPHYGEIKRFILK